MKQFIVAALALCALSPAAGQDFRDFSGGFYSKRGAALNYYNPSESAQYASGGPTQYRTIQAAGTAQKPSAYSQQDYAGLQAGQQAYTGPQQFYPAQAQTAAAKVPQFSLATDVSSFAYSSPVVKYNNQGITSQIIGKNPQSLSKTSSYSPSSQKSIYSTLPTGKTQYSPAQAVSFQSPQYSSSPQVTFSSSSPQKYSSQASTPDYTALAQKFALQAQEYSTQGQDYSSSADGQKYTSPQYLVQPQQYSAPPQQYSAQQYTQQPQQYVLPQQPQVVYSPQAEGHQAAQSVRQFSYSKPFGKFYPSRYNFDNY